MLTAFSCSNEAALLWIDNVPTAQPQPFHTGLAACRTAETGKYNFSNNTFTDEIVNMDITYVISLYLVHMRHTSRLMTFILFIFFRSSKTFRHGEWRLLATPKNRGVGDFRRLHRSFLATCGLELPGNPAHYRRSRKSKWPKVFVKCQVRWAIITAISTFSTTKMYLKA